MVIQDPLWRLLGVLFRGHPWHGVPIGENYPDEITTYIELVPRDTIKYELDKQSGILKVDRPQSFSNVCPTLYGLIPQTLCAERVAELCIERTGRQEIVGDNDPMDICVLTEKDIPHGDILLQAIPIGGLRVIDGNEADDKIIAVMKGDASFGHWTQISDVPQSVIKRLEHYFMTYKSAPDSEESIIEVVDLYDRDEAFDIIKRSHKDYLSRFSGFEDLLNIATKSMD